MESATPLRFPQRIASAIGLFTLCVAGFLPGFINQNAAQAAGTWTKVTSPPASISSIQILPSGDVVAGTSKGVYRSADEGKTWTASNKGLGQRAVNSIVQDQHGTGGLFLGAWGGLYHSSDDGRSWQLTGLDKYDIHSIVVDTHSSSTIYVTTAGSNGLFKSTDNGKTWKPCAVPISVNSTVQAMAFDNRTSSLFVAMRVMQGYSDHTRLRGSTDGGVSFEPRSRGIPNVDVCSIAAESTGTATYIGTYGEGVYRSNDSGNTWIPANSGLPSSAYVWTVVAHPIVNGVVLAGTSHGLFQSTNGGGFWTPFGEAIGDQSVLALAISTAGEGNIYAATWHGGLWKYTGQMVPLPTPTPTPTPSATPGASATATPMPTPTPKAQLPTDPVAPFTSNDQAWYFPETGHSLSHGFLSYWLTHGGVEQFGYPLTEEFQQGGTTVQYFERALLEYHPASGDQPERIVIGLLGRIATEGRYFINVWYFPTNEERIYFPETGHSLMHGFLNYWRNNGGIERFGYPISEEMDENGKTVQYFERARLEYNPEYAGTDKEISVGLLGREVLQKMEWLPR